MSCVRVVAVSEAELAKLVKTAVADALEQHQDAAESLEWVRLKSTGLPAKTIAAAIRSGALPARQVGRERWAKREDLHRWLESLPRVELGQTTDEGEDELERALQRGDLRSVGGRSR